MWRARGWRKKQGQRESGRRNGGRKKGRKKENKKRKRTKKHCLHAPDGRALDFSAPFSGQRFLRLTLKPLASHRSKAAGRSWPRDRSAVVALGVYFSPRSDRMPSQVYLDLVIAVGSRFFFFWDALRHGKPHLRAADSPTLTARVFCLSRTRPGADLGTDKQQQGAAITSLQHPRLARNLVRH